LTVAVPVNATAAPAHRPSRRHVIVQAAIRVFARRGFVEASVQDVADEAGMVPAAIYYHFAGKDELLDVALNTVIAEIDFVVEQARVARRSDAEASRPTVVGALWDWVETHSDEARILQRHLPGATFEVGELSRELEKGYAQRPSDYSGSSDAAASSRRAVADRAGATLAIRTLIALLMALHALRLDDGPLSKRSAEGLRRAFEDIATRMVGDAAS
jgi:AcrR family transcriptional regulator